MTQHFFIPMIPPTVTHQEKQVTVRNGKPKFYEPAELRTARARLTGEVYAFAPYAPAEGPVRLITRWIWPMGSRHKDGEYKTTKPDTDNLIKLLKDCMTAVGFWHDDAQVVSELTEKFWGVHPGIYIEVQQL